ncbi:MAG: BlaI/MecI/CopY family transcriptional regulator [Candidatus Delongbacteria bacterium]|nr:BlaI/MecI/CopY family transcriptional regulator [Candidatus Delongbacteria bacterium]MBN2833486.1 BlaI/MecI/CopY family transcriptional regulator [Candidatus Delongbacteria bacterium]
MEKVKLSDIEWAILNEIWKVKNASVREIADRINEDDNKAYTTIQTYMENLVKKKILKKEKIGLVNFYSAAISQEKIQKSESNKFLERAFEGSFSSFASFFLKKNRLSEKEIEELKKIIDEASDE